MLDVVVNGDGSVSIHADAETAATLAGREQFGSVLWIQELLQVKIRDAWYESLGR